MNLDYGIKKQRKLIALIHDAQTPINLDKQPEEAFIYPCPQAKVDELMAKYNELTNELHALTMPKE